MAEKAFVWAVTLGDRTVELRDLRIGVLAEIAKQTGHTLLECIGGPYTGDGTQLEPIVRAVAAEIGASAQVPEPFTFRDAVELMHTVPDDLPEPDPVPGDTAPPTSPAT